MNIKAVSLFSPALLVLGPMFVQWVAWIYGDTIGFETYRFTPYQEEKGHILFSIYVVATIAGFFIGHFTRNKVFVYEPSFRCVRRVVLFQLALLLISTALYARGGIDVTAFDEGVNVADLASSAREETLPGLTSFVFIGLALAPLLVYYRERFRTDAFFWRVSVTGVTVLLVLAIVFSGRVFVVYPLFALLFTYVCLTKQGKSISIARATAYLIFGLAAVFIVFSSMEYFRSWQIRRALYDVDYLTYSWELFTGGYLAQNHDNALTFLGLPSEFSVVASAPMFARIAELMGYQDIRMVANFNVDIGEGHGTVVIFGLLYQDMGLALSLIYMVVMMVIAQRLFKAATTTPNVSAILLYAVFVPHLLSMCRINSFGNVSFLVGIIGWALLRTCSGQGSEGKAVAVS